MLSEHLQCAGQLCLSNKRKSPALLKLALEYQDPWTGEDRDHTRNSSKLMQRKPTQPMVVQTTEQKLCGIFLAAKNHQKQRSSN
jgi:hypothetical protein